MPDTYSVNLVITCFVFNPYITTWLIRCFLFNPLHKFLQIQRDRFFRYRHKSTINMFT
ncbi:hypothetical protein ACJIZ3_012962 [Penstemon smallii]|uniref:Uncharacterized protein n=1 Tax=Penstemon smallii TaxID=265156 RepID=A0ABD3S3T4_9LAMI